MMKNKKRKAKKMKMKKKKETIGNLSNLNSIATHLKEAHLLCELHMRWVDRRGLEAR